MKENDTNVLLGQSRSSSASQAAGKSRLDPNVKRVYLTKAFLVEVEPKTFGLYRSTMIEYKDGTEEKVNDVGPISLFREIEEKEKTSSTVDLQTFHPVEKRPMSLKRIS